MPKLRIERLSKIHDRKDFTCGEPELDAFLARFSGQDDRRDYSRTYVLVEEENPQILGFYTLSAGSIAFKELPPNLNLPRYPMPVAHLGRMAIRKDQQGKGFGEILLMDALRSAHAISKQLGIAAIEVVAKSEKARNFYIRYGFVALNDDELHLYLPMSKVKSLFP